MLTHIKLRVPSKFNNKQTSVFAPVTVDNPSSMRRQVIDWCLDHGYVLQRVTPLETHLKLV